MSFRTLNYFIKKAERDAKRKAEAEAKKKAKEEEKNKKEG